MIKRMSRKRGFTLVELMIVVAIIGILAALAIYGVKRYLTNAKTGEAKANIGRLAKDAVSAYERESMAADLADADEATAAVHRLCGSVPTGKEVPASVPKGSKVQPNPTAWSDGDSTTSWRCLRFSLNDPLYYQYSYTATNPTADDASFVATATGDLDGDGTASAPWRYQGAKLGSAIRLATTIEEPTDPEE